MAFLPKQPTGALGDFCCHVESLGDFPSEDGRSVVTHRGNQSGQLGFGTEPSRDEITNTTFVVAQIFVAKLMCDCNATLDPPNVRIDSNQGPPPSPNVEGSTRQFCQRIERQSDVGTLTELTERVS